MSILYCADIYCVHGEVEEGDRFTLYPSHEVSKIAYNLLPFFPLQQRPCEGQEMSERAALREQL